MSKKNALLEGFVWSLENRPDDMVRERHTIRDTRSGLVWWVANEDYGFHLWEPNEIRFGYWQRRFAWRAVRGFLQGIEDRVIDELLAKMLAANTPESPADERARRGSPASEQGA